MISVRAALRGRWLSLAAGVVLAAGIGGSLWLSGGANQSSEPAEARRDTGRFQLVGVPPSARLFRVELQTEGLSGAQRLFTTSLQAGLLVRAVASDATGARFAAVMLEPKLSQAATGGDQPHLPVLEGQLGRAFEFSTLRSGAISEIALASGTDVTVARLIRSVLASIQVSDSEDGSDEWQAVEQQPDGSALVGYRYALDEGRLYREKLSLNRTRQQPAAVEAQMESARLVSSRGTVLLDARRRVTHIHSEERLSGKLPAIMGGSELLVTTLFTLSLPGDATARQAAALTVQPGQLRRPQPLDAEAGSSGPSYMADVQRIAGHTLPSILAELRRVDMQKGMSSAGTKGRLTIAAAALLRRHPEAVSQALEAIHDGAPDSDFLVSALGSAGSVEAMGALTTLLAEASDPVVARAVLRAIGDSSQASAEAVQAVAARFGDKQVGGLSRLMLGALAQKSRDETPTVSEQAVTRLLAALETETQILMIADTLRALGNSGDVRAVEAAQRFSNHASPIIRAAAAQAVRLVETVDAERVLLKLALDVSAPVRSSMLEACLSRRPTADLTSQVAQLTKLDADNNARREGIRVLVAWQADVPAAREALTWIANNEPNEKLRAVAAEGLARFGQDG